MVNRRKRLTPALSSRIFAEHLSGASYAVLAERHGVSQGTVAAALKQGRAAKAAAERGEPEARNDRRGAPAGGVDELDGVDGVAALLETAERLSRAAEAEGNLAGVATMGRLRVSLLEHRRKATPPPSPEDLGMVMVPATEMNALGAQVAERFFKMLDLVVEERAGECTACPTCGRPQAVAP